jgi:uncharacterized protein
MLLSRGIIFTAPIFLGLWTAFAQQPEADCTAAIRSERSLADKGNAQAQFLLGLRYARRLPVECVPEDYAAAVKWYRLAAEQGYGHAQSQLGLMYANGQGVPQDYTIALRWYRLAADQGDAQAENWLGDMYARGQGAAQNYSEALKWYRRSAEHGDVRTQTMFGLVYYEGAQGVLQEYSEAFKWFQRWETPVLGEVETPRSSRQGTRPAIDDLSVGYCARRRSPRSGLSRSDLVLWTLLGVKNEG